MTARSPHPRPHPHPHPHLMAYLPLLPPRPLQFPLVLQFIASRLLADRSSLRVRWSAASHLFAYNSSTLRATGRPLAKLQLQINQMLFNMAEVCN